MNKACNRVRLCAAAIFIASIALVRVGAAQDETLTPREAIEEKQPGETAAGSSTATLYPGPNYGGDFRHKNNTSIQ